MIVLPLAGRQCGVDNTPQTPVTPPQTQGRGYQQGVPAKLPVFDGYC
jgi:hypothetical protein